MPLAITPTFSPWTHTSDDSYIYQLSLVLATATVSLHIFRVPSSVQQQLLPCEDNNNNNNNNKINAYKNNNNKILGTQSKSAAYQDSLGRVGPLVYTMYELSGGGYTIRTYIKCKL